MSTFELIAAILGAGSVWMVVRRNIWAFPIGIVMVAMYAWIFYESKLYSDMLLQGIFLVMQIQGWIAWKGGQRADDERIAIRTLNTRQWVVTGIAQVVGTITLGYFMDTCTDAAMPYADAFAAIQSIAAQWWMNTRYLENWILWIAVDEVYLFIYSSKDLWYTTALYALFLAMAIAGYIEWRKKIPQSG